MQHADEPSFVDEEDWVAALAAANARANTIEPADEVEAVEPAEPPVALSSEFTDEAIDAWLEPIPSEDLALEVARLVELLRSGRSILCAGPRLVEGRLTCVELIARLLSTLPAAETRDVWPVLERNPLAAAGFVRRRLGAEFASELRMATSGLALPGIARMLGALPFRGLVTTSYDDTIDEAFAREGRPLRVYTPRDGAALAKDAKQPFVLKVLGDVSREDTLVWSSEDLQLALADAEFRAAAHELYRSRSFLFVGFQRTDLDLLILLERVFAGANPGEVEHYAVLPGLSEIEKDELFAAWKIRVLSEENADALAHALQTALAATLAEELPADDDTDGWLALLAEDPARADAIDRLDRMGAELHEQGDYDQLIELVIGRVAIEPEAARRAEMLLKIARIFEHDADDPERALTTLMAAYKEDPGLAAWRDLERLATAAAGWDGLESEFADVLPSLPAEVRAPLYRRLQRWPELAEALDRLAANPGEHDARALRIEAAELYASQLADPLSATARYEALASETPHHLGILRALERLYELEGRHEKYLKILARQVGAVETNEERATLYRRLALLWEEEPDGATRAEALWETLLDLEPQAEDALRALARLYAVEHKWPELIEALRRHAAFSSLPVQAELYGKIGELYERELRDFDNALEAYRVADAASSSPETLAALTRLCELTGASEQAIELLDRRALLTRDPGVALGFIYRAGVLCGDRHDKAGAEKRLSRVLELDPEHAQAMTALADLYRQSGEFLRAAKLFVEAVGHALNRLERTRLLVAAGEMYERVDDPHRAAELFLEALSEDPEHLHAAERAAELLAPTDRHADLMPVLELLVRKQAPDEVQVERLVRLGRAAVALELDDKADKAFARAAELDPKHLHAQRSLAAHHLRNERWAPALSALDRVFQHHIDRLPVGEHVELFSEMGRCELMLGSREGARELLARALELDPTHRPSLLAQMKLAEGSPRVLINAKRSLLATANGDERLRLLSEIGDLHAELKDLPGAIGVWRQALEVKPDDHRLLHKTLEACVEERSWIEALDMLERLIEIEKTATVRARYELTAGFICRDELKRAEAAVNHLRGALDDDPGLDRAALALEQLYVAGGEWKELARFYRNVLKRLGPESPSGADGDGLNKERLRVWSQLGELCWEKLGERESALAALEVALTLDGDDLERQKRLADLYVQNGPSTFDKSIAAHQRILRQEKSRILSYRALKHLYIQTEQREKSVRCSYVLQLLHKGEPDDARKVAEYKRRKFATARRVLGEDGWARLVHPDEDRGLDLLFALVGPTVVAGQAKPHKALGLVRKDAIASDDPHSYKKALDYLATTFDVVAPEVYVRPEQREPVLFANCIDGRSLTPVLLLGQPLVGSSRDKTEQVFELARVMVHLRPERMLRLAMPHPQPLAQVIEAAMALGAEGDGEPAATDVIGDVVLGLKRALPLAEIEQVAAIGQKLRAIGTRPEAAALRWLQATDLTGLRAGWVMVGDLETCARLAAADGHAAGSLPPTQRLLDLAWSSTTEELMAVRKLLGLS